MRISEQAKRRFIVVHELLFRRAKKNKKAEQDIALLAVKELGYSPSTTSIDILRVLRNVEKRMKTGG
jgi:hypothetical protein